MKKYKLIVVGGDEPLTGEYDHVVKGFAAAEEKAKELLNEYLPDYYDAYVACFEKDDTPFLFGYLMYSQDCFGEQYWRIMVMSPYGPLYPRSLRDDEKDDIDMLREEVERCLYELSEDELRELRGEIRVGSIYLSDYKNSFGIDENEVCDVAEKYDKYLCTDDCGKELPEDQWKKDTPEEFAYYCLNFL